MLIGSDGPTFGPAPNPEPVSGAGVMGCHWPDGGQVFPVEPGEGMVSQWRVEVLVAEECVGWTKIMDVHRLVLRTLRVKA